MAKKLHFKGFTLVEIIVASALFITASVIGIAEYRNYAESQVIKNAAYDVSIMLQKAKSRAQTQIKPANIANCQTNSLNGYEVKFCSIPLSQCAAPAADRYELHVVCGLTRSLIEFRKLPAGVTITNTSTPSFYFTVIHSTVNTGSVRLNSAGQQKTVQVNGLGHISIQ